MSKFTSITLPEMEEFLGTSNGKPVEGSEWSFYNMSLPRMREAVFGMRVSENLSLRIYTTIENGLSRKIGTDAIRCTLFWRKDAQSEPKLVGVEKKVLRIGTWRKNLRNRIENWKDMVGPNCPNCEAPMVNRKSGKGNRFFGCPNYPECKGAKSLQ